MTLHLIQGFDYFATTNDPTVPFLDETDAERLLGFRAPANNAGATWFINNAGTTEGLIIEATTARIDGKSLEIARQYEGATYNPQFHGIKHLDFTKTFTQSDRCVVGWALLIDTAPTSDIPILQFFYDNGGEAEQLSLWITPTGRFYVGNTDFDVTDDTTQANTAIGSAQSATGAFRFNTFVYLEADLDYTATLPTLTLYVNGTAVLTVASSSMRKSSGDFIDGVSIIIPHNQYWGATGAFTAYIDDIYITTDEAPYGPQHISVLYPNSTETDNWVGSSGNKHDILDNAFDPASLTPYVYNDAADDKDVYGLDNAGASIVTITAVAPTIIASIDSGSDVLKLGIADSVSATELVSGASVTVDNTSPKFYQTFFDTNADDAAWTNTLLDQLELILDLS